jgi:hypothetical protein
MPTPPPASGPVRSAAELNARIRALWMAGRGHPALPLSAEQRAEYQQLREEWAEAVRGEVVEAA